MRRSIVLVSLLGMGGALAGCSIETDPPKDPPVTPDTCVPTSVTPTFGAAGVGTRPDITVTYNQDIDVTALETEIALAQLGAEEVPFTVEATDARTIVIRPVNELRYWGDYQATVSGALKTADGTKTCEPVDLAFQTFAPIEEPQPLRATQVASSVLIDATHLVSASPSARSIQVYSVADPKKPSLVSEVRMEEGPQSLAVDVDAVTFTNRLYAAAGPLGIPIYDTSDPVAPKRIGLAGTPGEARRVIPFEAAGKALLIVADGPGGVRILDVTKADGGKDVWVGNVIEGAASIAKQGNLLAVVDLEGVVSLFDITDPAKPVLHSTVAPAPSEDTFNVAIPFSDVAIVGTELVASQGYAGFESFDITDPKAPLFQAHLLGPQGKCASGCPDAVGDLHVSNGEVFAVSAMTGAVRVSVSDVGAMTIETVFQAPGVIRSLSRAGDGTLLVGGDAGLFAFDGDASSPASPVFSEANGWGVDWGVAVSGDQVYVSSSSRGLETFDRKNPLAPASHALASSPGVERDVGQYSVAVAGNVVFVGDGRAGVSVYDATLANAPVYASSSASADSAGVVVPSSDPTYFYACLDNLGVGVFDVSNPLMPVLVDQHPELNAEAGGCKDLEVVGDRVYYSGGSGLAVMDATDPKALIVKSSLKLPAEDYIGSLAFSSAIPGRLFTTTQVFDWEGTHNRTQRLLSFDITDPDNPKVAYRSEDLGGARTIELHDTKAWVGNGGEGVAVFDLSDPDLPFLEGKIATRGNVQRLAFADGIVYAAELAGGLGVIGIQPAAPTP